MSQKNIGAVLLAVAATLGGPVAVDQAIKMNDRPAVEVVIGGPSEAEIGELIRLTLTGTKTAWKMPTTDIYIIDDNNAIVTFREPGEYTIIASALDGRRTAIAEHTIMVLGPPAPKPQPNLPSLTDTVYQWCVDSDAPKPKCKTLGRNFMTAAESAVTIEGILSSVAKANRKADQKGCEQVLARIQQHLFDNLSGDGFNQHRDAFNEIGVGLLKWSETQL